MSGNKQESLASGCNNVSNTARLAPEKGLHHLVDAFLDLKTRPNTQQVHIKSGSWAGRQVSNLPAIVGRLKPAQPVLLADHRLDASATLQQSLVVNFDQRQRTWGHSIQGLWES